MSEREQLIRIRRALDSATKTADLIDQAYATAIELELATRLRIASQDVGAVIVMLRAAEAAQEEQFEGARAGSGPALADTHHAVKERSA